MYALGLIMTFVARQRVECHCDSEPTCCISPANSGEELFHGLVWSLSQTTCVICAVGTRYPNLGRNGSMVPGCHMTYCYIL